MTAKSRSDRKPTAEDYEKLGRTIEGMLINDYLDLLANPRRQLRSAFVRGIFTGLGTVLGATIVVGALVWLLHQLGGLPVIGDYLQGAGNTIQQ